MALVAELKKTVSQATPVYAAVGATDVAVEKVREVRTQATAAGKALRSVDPKDAPAVLLNRGLEIADRAQQQYEAFAVRGKTLVRRIRDQKPTKDLLAQVDQTVSVGKGAVTTVRRAVAETQHSAIATLTTGRHEAARTADVVADQLERDARATAGSVGESARTTTAAARRTAATAREGAAASTARTKAATTTARKTAARARRATAAAASKVGD